MKETYTIDTDIYPKNIIKQAITDFKDVAKVEFKDGNIVIFWDTKEEIENVFNELLNYAIWLINE